MCDTVATPSKKKIGIITVHQSVNFGATLQAFASNYFLRSRGYDAQTVDYRQPALEINSTVCGNIRASWRNDKNRNPVHRLKLAISLTMSYPGKAARYKAFAKFRQKWLPMSKPCHNAEAIAALDYTHLVYGSDQIWNSDITCGADPVFFGAIPGAHKNIAYAASMGKACFSPEDEPRAAVWLIELDRCGVRELQMVPYISQLTGKPAVQVLDPVFLPDAEVYRKIMAPPQEIKPYVLLYCVVANSDAVRMARELAAKHRLTLIEICSAKPHRSKHKVVANIGPGEFLRYFADASYIVTNSFHGTAFSILFEKSFWAVDNKNRGSRILDLLKISGLSHRMVENEIPEDNEAIDYSLVNQNLETEREHSRRFLLDALER